MDILNKRVYYYSQREKEALKPTVSKGCKTIEKQSRGGRVEGYYIF